MPTRNDDSSMPSTLPAPSFPPLASERPVPSRPGLTMGTALARVRDLARAILRDRDVHSARERMAKATELVVLLRASVDAHAEDPAFEPLVAASRDAIDIANNELDAAAVHLSELERAHR